MSKIPQKRRVAAYALITRGDRVLLSRLSAKVTRDEMWTLPGGGIDHGEAPRDGVVREVYEETGLRATVGEEARVYSVHWPNRFHRGQRQDVQALRIVYEGWVPSDSPPPRVTELEGSTMASDWIAIDDVMSSAVPTVEVVRDALRDLRTHRFQRIGAYAIVQRNEPEPQILLTRISAHAASGGNWHLPGGGVEHGEAPAKAVLRELYEETGYDGEIVRLVTLADQHFVGTAPTGRQEDFHGLYAIYEVDVRSVVPPKIVDAEGTTDAVEWVSLREVEAGARPMSTVLHTALAEIAASSQ